MEKKMCQSCGMPLIKEGDFGKNSDGSRNEDYCTYCFPNGKFSKDETLDEMIESCIPFEIEAGCKDEETARANLKEFLPTLKRWNNK